MGVIASRRDTSIDLEIPLACEIIWNVQVEAHGIVLSAKFIDKGSNEERLLFPEPVKVKAEDGLQMYKFSFDEPGKVIFTYDNRHSRFRGKSVNYRVDVNVLEDVKTKEEGDK